MVNDVNEKIVGSAGERGVLAVEAFQGKVRVQRLCRLDILV